MEIEHADCCTDAETTFQHKIDIRNVEEVHQDAIVSADLRGNSASLEQQPLVTDLRNPAEGCLSSLPSSRQVSVSGGFLGHAVADTCVCTRLSLTPLSYLGIGYRWMINLVTFFLHGLFVLPGIVQVGWHYFSDKRIHRSIPYGQEPRNRLDLYLPPNLETPKPVVVFVAGGAWVIGYKAWGSLLALQLVEEDVIVACIDYRNFPQGTISDMVEDVSQGISFICNNIGNYGGDLDRLYLVGQSAGAHLGACALLEQAKKQTEGGNGEISTQEHEREETLLWRASQFKAYVGISGGYNLYKLVDHFHNRGMHRTLFFRIMEGEGSLLRYSPELRLQSLPIEKAGSLLPPVYLFHGTDDHSIPCSSSTSFTEALTSAGVQATTILYEGKSHTDLFLQDPMRGGYNALLEDILVVLNLGDTQVQGKDASRRLQRRMVPEVLLQFAHRISFF